MEHFEIDVHKGGEQVDFITCPSKQLRIKVIAPGKQPNAYRPDQMVISANLTIKGRYQTYHFEIIQPADGTINKDWSVNLFMEAIEYYCQNIFDREPDGFDYNPGNPLFIPYDNTGDYVV